jgi:hypothetical protein
VLCWSNNDQNATLAPLSRTIQLHEKLGFDAPTRLVCVGFVLREKAIDFVDGNDNGISVSRNHEESADQLLAFTNPFGSQ